MGCEQKITLVFDPERKICFIRQVNSIFRTLFVLMWFLSSMEAAPPIFRLKDVRPGLKGECRTVLAGTKIETFQFEVMDVGRDFSGPGRDIIWCKIISDPTGRLVVAAGMSGSPCFIEGRMMGALAYGWMLAKEPVFGVQPIESMLEVLNFKGNERASNSPGPKGFTPATNPNRFASEEPAFLKSSAVFTKMFPAMPREATPQMLPLPLEVAGLHPLIAERVGRCLTEAGFRPLMGGVGGLSATADRAELVPGAALTGVIARGDLNMAATGTLTWRDGNRILAFGHPFLNVGAVNIPMGKAEIVGVVSSYLQSFKMSNKGNVVGTLTQDRMSAVGGVIGQIPRFTPMTVGVKRSGRAQEFKLEFCDNKFFTPAVYQTALNQFLALVMENTEEATLRIRSKIEFDGSPPLVFEDVYAGERFSWVMEAVMNTTMQLMPIYENEFGTPAVRRITVEADVQPTVNAATLEEIAVEPLKAHPGDTLRIRAGFQPWHGKRFFREYSVKLPEEVKSGEVTLVLADAQRADQMDGPPRTIGFGSGSFSFYSASRSNPRNLDQLIATLNDRHRRDRLYLFLQKKSEGLHLQNQRLTALPESVRELLSNDQTAGDLSPIHDSLLSKTVIDFGSVVEGNCSATIRIK